MSSDLEASFIIVETGTRPVGPSEVKPPVNPDHPSCFDSYIPGTVDGYAHDWSKSHLKTYGRHFVDQYGRVCNLRGVNLSGCSKAPVNHDNDSFPDSDQAKIVTFVGRPFPILQAHEHLSRLRRWGLSFVRFLVTWEAIEHAGPGIYDTEYLQYLEKVISLLPKYGMVAFVALHQDVWSRYSGGSGAPAWTLEVAGFDLLALEETGAAWLKGMKGGGHIESERGLWPCGYQKLTAATMSTLFWGGDVFAPLLRVKDNKGQMVSIQKFLQDSFLNMFERLVSSVGHLEAVIGFEPFNEPHPGYINLGSLHGFDYNTDLHLSFLRHLNPSNWVMAWPTLVSEWTRSFPMPTRKTSAAVIDPKGRRAWRADGPSNGECIWKMHGVWAYDTTKKQSVVLRESYFSRHPMTGEKLDFYVDFFNPFLHRWANRIRSTYPEKILFLEAIPNEFCPSSFIDLPNTVYAPHWYDLNALFMKAFGDFTVNVQGLSRGMFPLKAFYWGQEGARENYFLQIRNIVEAGYRSLGEKPVIIGEAGVPMDMNKGEAFVTDDFSWQARMMDALLTGLERSLIGFTLWNYNPANNDQDGDNWNGENFSWFSGSRALPASLLDYDQTAVTLDNGGRILSAVVRPYPAKTAGIPTRFEYEATTGKFTYEWVVPDQTKAFIRAVPSTIYAPPTRGHRLLKSRETEIFIPALITAARTLTVEGLDSEATYRYDNSHQTLFILTKDMTPGKKYQVTVSVSPELRPVFQVNSFIGDFGGRLVAIAVVIFALVTYGVLNH
ncbi:cytoplasmic protein [Mycena floridula]|nr:cytoplasmic protein [Mycena floridula]